MIVWFLLILIWVNAIETAHFNGGTITWAPVYPNSNSTTVLITITQSYSWVYPTVGCATNIPTTGAGTNLICVGNCSTQGGFATQTISILTDCTSFSASLNVVFSQRSVNISLNESTYFWIGYRGSAWRSLQNGATGTPGWSIVSLIDLRRRSDGLINTPPVSQVTSPQYVIVNRTTTIKIPVSDVNAGDDLRCRWAKQNSSSGVDECNGVCTSANVTSLTNLTGCTLTFTSTVSGGWYAIALQLEDFENTTSTSPMSSVSIQFLIYVLPTPNCTQSPVIIPLTGCLEVQVNVSVNFTLYAMNYCNRTKVIITDLISTVDAPGMSLSSLANLTTNTSLVYATLTWTPQSNQIGPQQFCAVAYTTEKVQSAPYCVTFIVTTSKPCTTTTTSTTTTTTSTTSHTTTTTTETETTSTSTTSDTTTTTTETTTTITTSETTTTTSETTTTSTTTETTTTTSETTTTSTTTETTTTTSETTTTSTTTETTTTTSETTTTSTTSKTTTTSTTTSSTTSETTTTTSTTTTTTSETTTTSTTTETTTTTSETTTTSTTSETTTTSSTTSSTTSDTTTTTSTTTTTTSETTTTTSTTTKTTTTTTSTQTTTTTTTITTSTTSTTTTTTSTTSETTTTTTSTQTTTTTTTTQTTTTTTTTTSTTSKTTSTTTSTQTTSTTTTTVTTTTTTTDTTTTVTTATTTSATTSTGTTTITVPRSGQINIPLIVGLSILGLLLALAGSFSILYYLKRRAPARRRRLNKMKKDLRIETDTLSVEEEPTEILPSRRSQKYITSNELNTQETSSNLPSSNPIEKMPTSTTDNDRINSADTIIVKEISEPPKGEHTLIKPHQQQNSHSDMLTVKVKKIPKSHQQQDFDDDMSTIKVKKIAKPPEKEYTSIKLHQQQGSDDDMSTVKVKKIAKPPEREYTSMKSHQQQGSDGDVPTVKVEKISKSSQGEHTYQQQGSDDASSTVQVKKISKPSSGEHIHHQHDSDCDISTVKVKKISKSPQEDRTYHQQDFDDDIPIVKVMKILKPSNGEHIHQEQDSDCDMSTVKVDKIPKSLNREHTYQQQDFDDDMSTIEVKKMTKPSKGERRYQQQAFDHDMSTVPVKKISKSPNGEHTSIKSHRQQDSDDDTPTVKKKSRTQYSSFTVTTMKKPLNGLELINDNTSNRSPTLCYGENESTPASSPKYHVVKLLKNKVSATSFKTRANTFSISNDWRIRNFNDTDNMNNNKSVDDISRQKPSRDNLISIFKPQENQISTPQSSRGIVVKIHSARNNQVGDINCPNINENDDIRTRASSFGGATVTKMKAGTTKGKSFVDYPVSTIGSSNDKTGTSNQVIVVSIKKQ